MNFSRKALNKRRAKLRHFLAHVIQCALACNGILELILPTIGFPLDCHSQSVQKIYLVASSNLEER